MTFFAAADNRDLPHDVILGEPIPFKAILELLNLSEDQLRANLAVNPSTIEKKGANAVAVEKKAKVEFYVKLLVEKHADWLSERSTWTVLPTSMKKERKRNAAACRKFFYDVDQYLGVSLLCYASLEPLPKRARVIRYDLLAPLEFLRF